MIFIDIILSHSLWVEKNCHFAKMFHLEIGYRNANQIIFSKGKWHNKILEYFSHLPKYFMWKDSDKQSKLY